MTRMPRDAAAVQLPPFQLLVDAHAEAVLRLLVRRVGAADAEDCFQETFLAALRAYPQLQRTENLRGWLLTIARNKAIDRLRETGRHPSLPLADDMPAPAPPDAGVWDDVRQLPGKQRAAVLLRFAEDQSYDDIAARMTTSPAAARRNVHEGIKKLRGAR